MTGLGSAPLPEPGADDHIAGCPDAVLVVEYADFECSYCAVLSGLLREAPVRRVFRHFPVRSSHPRAWAAACAAEAAALQGHFWEMHDSLFADQSSLEDPHLWVRADELELDLARFDADRRGDTVLARVQRDFHSGVRAGVVSTPTLFIEGRTHVGRAAIVALETLLER
ncbi:MAG: DsbA family protein [Solirubrobacteraceae bacterium]